MQTPVTDAFKEMDMQLRILDAKRLAQDAFWSALAKQFPEATSGDFPPDAAFLFDSACSSAVSVWLKGNMPDPAACLATIVEFILEHVEWWDGQVEARFAHAGQEELSSWLATASKALASEVLPALREFVRLVDEQAIDWLNSEDVDTEHELLDEARSYI